MPNLFRGKALKIASARNKPLLTRPKGERRHLMRRAIRVMAASFLATSMSCGGEVGPQGPAGPQGPQGTMGLAGEQVASPSGIIVAFAGQQAPPGWLLCDGSEVDRGQYAGLFALIGVTYGAGDAVRTFNLPDLRGRTAIGVGQGPGLTMRNLGQKAGAETHRLTVAQMPAHSHSTIAGPRFLVYNSAGVRGVVVGADAGFRVDDNNDDALMSKAGGDEPHNIMPPSLALSYIIKY